MLLAAPLLYVGHCQNGVLITQSDIEAAIEARLLSIGKITRSIVEPVLRTLDSARLKLDPAGVPSHRSTLSQISNRGTCVKTKPWGVDAVLDGERLNV